MNEPKVSFVVPVYNTKSYALECLESITQQEGSYSYEVIVIDDCSQDGVSEIVGPYCQQRGWYYYRNDINKGAAFTINKGLLLAKGEYIARIDSDDIYNKRFLTETIPMLDKYKDCAFVFGKIRMIDAQGKFLSDAKNSSLPDQSGYIKSIFYPLLKENFVSAPTVIGRNKAWNGALPIPENMNFNDWYLMLSMAKDNPCYYLDTILADYRLHDNNMHSSMIKDGTGEQIYFEVLDLFLKYEKNKKLKKKIYAGWYEKLGNSYFGNNMFHDARRAYLKALIHSPYKILATPIARRLVASLFSFRLYTKIKKVVKLG